MIKLTGLEGIVAAETAVGHVDGERGHLIYRGHWAKELAVKYGFEEVAYLLWHGSLPEDGELAEFRNRLREARALPEHLLRMIEAMPPSVPMMSVLQSAVASLAGEGMAWPPTLAQAVRITSLIPTVIAARHRLVQGLRPIAPDDSLGHVANYLYMLTGERPDSAHVRALSAYAVLGMEHGLNASTFAARVIASTQSDLASAVGGAIGAMKGPLHGGAPSGVIDMLEAIGEVDAAEPWIRAALERGERLMGFGHRVYKTTDPRAEALREVTAGLTGDDPWFRLAIHVEQTAIRLLEEFKPGRKLYTNVEFFAAAVMRAIDLPAELFTPTFTASRVVGWTAHVLEQADFNRIFRPKSHYVGSMPKE